jgi:hypothetical protein
LKNNLRLPKIALPIKEDVKKAIGIVLKAAQWTAAFVFRSVPSPSIPIVFAKKKIAKELMFKRVKTTEKTSKKIKNVKEEMRSETV